MSQEKLIFQAHTNLNERIHLETNNESFVSGETLLYKFHSRDIVQNTYSTVSKIGYVELIDSSKKSVLQQKISLSHGNGDGSIFIGPSLKTGIYKLVGYTLWTLNNPAEATFQKNIIIINPYQRDFPDYFTTSLQIATTPEKSDGKQKINTPEKTTIATLQKKYTKRQQVICHIETSNNLTGVFSLSVRKKDSLKVPNSSNNSSKKGATRQSITENRFTLPEFRGEIVSGKIISKIPSLKTSEIPVSLSIPGNSFYLSNTRTKENGVFTFLLEDNTNTSEAVVQVLDVNRDNYLIEIDSPKEYAKFNSEIVFPQEVYFPTSTKKGIEERSIASQIENNYYASKKDSLKPKEKNLPFYNSLERYYLLDDYTRFPTLKETIVEIIPELYYTQTKNSYTIHIRDYDSQSGSLGDALVLADGVPIQNINELFEYDALNIHKIAIVNKSYILGSKIYNGIVNIITKNNDYKIKTTGDYIKDVSLERPLAKQIPYNPDYSKETLERIPDFRYQLYWNPEITEINNSQEFSFFTSDVIGEFEIILSGFTNYGEPILLSNSFIVE